MSTPETAESPENQAPETPNPLLRHVEVEIPAATMAEESEKLLRKYQKMVRLPGFRPGKAPLSMLRQRFGQDLRQELLESLVPRYFRQAVEKEGYKPITQPRIRDMQGNEQEGVRFRAEFEVLPEFEPHGYDSISVEAQETAVTEEEITQAIEHLRQQRATFDAVEEERALADGDFASVAVKGEPKADVAAPPAEAAAPSEATEDESAEAAPTQEAQPVELPDVLIEIGGENTVAEFSQNLRGARPGEERTFDVTYPADFSDERLAGKTLAYTVTVKGIKRKSLPELDEAFVRELGGPFQTVEELRGHFRTRMEEEKRHSAEHAAQDLLMKELLEKNEFPVPEALVEHQIDLRLERGLRALAQQGMREEDMRRLDFTRLRSGQREAALREVKASLLLEKIADKENIQVSEEEVDREIDSIAIQTQQGRDAVVQRLTKEGAIDRIRDRIRTEKTLKFLTKRSA